VWRTEEQFTEARITWHKSESSSATWTILRLYVAYWWHWTWQGLIFRNPKIDLLRVILILGLIAHSTASLNTALCTEVGFRRRNLLFSGRSEVLTAVNMNIAVFCGLGECSLIDRYKLFGEICRQRLQNVLNLHGVTSWMDSNLQNIDAWRKRKNVIYNVLSIVWIDM
jgi:hypothetical protein